MLVGDLYTDVTTVMLEDGGFESGLATEQQFLDFYASVMSDFLDRTGLVKLIALQAQEFGEQNYDAPDWISDIEAAFTDGATLFRDTEDSISSRNRGWRSDVGTPKGWRQDKNLMNVLAVYPGPKVQGSAGGQDPGIVAGWVPGNPPDQALAFIGTLSQSGQVAAFATPGTFFTGDPAGDVAKPYAKNIAMLGKAGLMSQVIQLTDSIESLPDTFVIFIKYGILAKIWGVDGENRDPQRERYCRARYDEGVGLAKAIMGEELEAA